MAIKSEGAALAARSTQLSSHLGRGEAGFYTSELTTYDATIPMVVKTILTMASLDDSHHETRWWPILPLLI